MFRMILAATVVWAVTSIPANAEGDAAAGAKVFNRCKSCHVADKPENKVGPYLLGVVGRPIASVADYTKYSDAMKAKGTEGLSWDEATLANYLGDPKGFIPGNNMAFGGLKKPQDVANVIAFLKGMPAK